MWPRSAETLTHTLLFLQHSFLYTLTHSLRLEGNTSPHTVRRESDLKQAHLQSTNLINYLTISRVQLKQQGIKQACMAFLLCSHGYKECCSHVPALRWPQQLWRLLVMSRSIHLCSNGTVATTDKLQTEQHWLLGIYAKDHKLPKIATFRPSYWKLKCLFQTEEGDKLLTGKESSYFPSLPYGSSDVEYQDQITSTLNKPFCWAEAIL